nr:FAD:protein FMN transferase [Eubacterium sp.]
DDTYELLKKSLEVAEKTEGFFEPTIYPIVKLWGFTTQEYRVPSDAEISDTLKKVGYKNVELKENNIVKIKPGTMIDLGACAKGYLSDKLCDMIRAEGVSGIVSLGGNVKSVGTKTDGKPFTVGITDPSDGRSIYTTVESSDTAVVTSGNYERFFEKDGKKYHHIFDKNTGAPAEGDIASVTVIGTDGFVCDAYATALFVAGEVAAKRFVADNPGYSVYLIKKDNSLQKI